MQEGLKVDPKLTLVLELGHEKQEFEMEDPENLLLRSQGKFEEHLSGVLAKGSEARIEHSLGCLQCQLIQTEGVDSSVDASRTFCTQVSFSLANDLPQLFLCL